MVKIYKQPFAHDGDAIAIPSASQPDGKMSSADGWTPDYQLLKTDPNYKPVGRQEMNGVFKEVTEALGQVQVQGAASWSVDGAPYPVNAQVYHNGKQWRSNIINNSGEPGVSGWDDASVFADALNAAQASIAVASTVNLTTGAKNTSHVLLTDGGTVNNFTVEAGRTYFVTLGAATTFTVSASIDTGNARSIVGRLGDTLILYATAANTVRVIMHQPRDGWGNLSSANGYQIFPSGMVIQWGYLVNSATAGAPTAVVFPISLSVIRQVSNTADAATNVNSACWVDNLITTGFNSRCAVANASSRWFAYGFL